MNPANTAANATCSGPVEAEVEVDAVGVEVEAEYPEVPDVVATLLESLVDTDDPPEPISIVKELADVSIKLVTSFSSAASILS